MAGKMSDEFVLFFDPSQWTAARRLQVFVGPPLIHPEVRRGAEASMSHLEKYQVLVGLLNGLSPAVAFTTLVHEYAHLCPVVGYVRSTPKC